MVKQDLVSGSLKDVKQALDELEKSLKGTVEGTEEYNEIIKKANAIAKDYYEATGKQVQVNMHLEGSYNALQKEMNVLRKEWKATNDEAVRNEIGARMADINEQLKDFDHSIGNYHRDVGTYVEALKPVSQQLGEIEDEMRQMLANGVSPLDEGFQELAKQAGVLKNAQDSVGKIIDANARVTSRLSDGISILSSVTAGYGAVTGALEMFGIENEKVEESIKKLNAVMTVLNSLNTINEQLTDKSTGTYKLYQKIVSMVGLSKRQDAAATQAQTAATTANTVAVTASSKALTGLKAALISTGIGAIVVAVGMLVAHWDKLKIGVEKVVKSVKDFFKENSGFAKVATIMSPAIAAVRLFHDVWERIAPTVKEAGEAVKDFFSDSDKARLENLNGIAADYIKKMEREADLMKARGEDDRKIWQFRIKKYNETLQAYKERHAESEEVQKDIDEEKRKIEELIDEAKHQIAIIDEKAKHEKTTAKETKDTKKEEQDAYKQATDIINGYIEAKKRQYDAERNIRDLETELLKTQGKLTDTEAHERLIGELEKEKKLYEDIIKTGGATVDNLNALREINLEIEIANAKFSNESKEKATQEAMDGLARTFEENKSKIDFDIEMGKVTGMSESDIHELEKQKQQLTEQFLQDSINAATSPEEKYQLERELITSQNEWKLKEAKRTADKEAEIQRAKEATVVASTQAIVDVMGAVTDVMEDNINRKLKEGKISEEQAEKEFERVKKLQLATLWISTLSGAAGAFLQDMKSYPSPYNAIIAGIDFATAMALGVSQHRKIKSQSFGSGGGDGGGSAGLQAIAVQPLLDDNEAYNSMSTLQIQGGQYNADTRVYILESDIQDSVNRVEVRETANSF